MTTRF